MAFYSSAVGSWTPAAVADGAICTANNQHCLHCVASTTARITELFIGGEATASSVNAMALRRMTTNSTTPTVRTATPTNILSIAAASVQPYITASTLPTTAALATIQHVLSLSHNAFGGIVRLSLYQTGAEIYLTGAAANNSDIGMVNVTGTGQVSSHMVWEEL